MNDKISSTDTSLNRATSSAAGRNGLSIAELRAALKGRVIVPEDEGYDAARTIFYGGIDRRPAAIVRAADANDVARVVSLARQAGVELAVRSGGHSAVGHGVSDGGIVLDLKDMKGLQIDAANRTAWAEAGLTAGEFTQAAAAHGLVNGFGDTGSVGIGGITLGGGIGYLVRKHGLTIDNLLAAEIVTADGKLRYVDSQTHPDLFWAIRGGGGNFGVVTRFKYQLHPLDKIVGGMLILPATADVLAGFIAAAEAAPDELSTIANVMSAPPMPFLPPEAHGKMILMGMLVYAGDAEAGQRAIAPFRALAAPIADMIRPMTYPEMFPPEDENYHPTAVGRNLFVNTIDRERAQTIIDCLQDSDAVFRVAQLRVLGGAMARVPVDATAFAHRQAPIMVNLAAFYTSPEDRALREAWVDEFAASLRQDYTGAYVNFLNNDGSTWAHSAYPEATWERLAAVKARYDPTNLFHMNHNIPPAVAP